MMGAGATPLARLPTLNPTPHRHHPLLSFTSINIKNAKNRPQNTPLLSNTLNPRQFSVSASKRRQKEPPISIAVADDSDDDGFDEEEGDEGEEVIDMDQWMENKPKGFGEGKTYDTALEEKLLEEIERSREAQIANIEKLKSAENAAAAKKQEPPRKEIDVVPDGTRVRVSNLPRKRNIHRDLTVAFKEFPGIVKISPAVIGNQKTRDPICKGFAFVDLKSEEAAKRFAQKYSKQIVIFGKVQKQISCDVINPSSSRDDSETFNRHTEKDVEVSKNSKTNNINHNYVLVDSPSVEESTQLVKGTDHLSSQHEETEADIDHLRISRSDGPKSGGESGSTDSSSLQKGRKQAASKKKIIKRKTVKAPMLSASGSMARLKVKERTVLSGVFSKYGGQVSTESSKQS